MKTRKFLFISFFVAMMGVTTNSSAGSLADYWNYLRFGAVVDDQNRRLNDHETIGNNRRGHTIKKHINALDVDIAERCLKDSAVRTRHSTRYARSFISLPFVASESIKDVIDKHQGTINLFAKGKSTRSIYIGDLKAGESSGVNCKEVKESDFDFVIGFRPPMKIYTGPLITNYPHNIVRIKRKATEKGGWYIFTSFPTYRAN